MACRMVMVLPAVVSVALASATSANSMMAAVNAGLCTDADASCTRAVSSSSSASTDPPAEVMLLQVAKGRADATRMNLPDQTSTEEHDTAEKQGSDVTHALNMTKVWEDLGVTARVDKLGTALQALSKSNLTDHLREDLNKVWSSLPVVEQVKKLFSHQQSANISNVDIEDLRTSLFEVKADSVEAGELRRQLQGPLSNVTIADVQEQVANMWNDMHGEGSAFPNIDNFTAHAEEFRARAEDFKAHAGDVVKDFVSNVNSTLAGGALEAVRGLVEGMKASASDGVPE